MRFEIEIPDEELKNAVKETVIKAIHDTTYRGDYRKFEKLYRDMVKEMLYEPETKKMLIDQAVNVAAHEIRRKAMPGLFDALMKGKQEANCGADTRG